MAWLSVILVVLLQILFAVLVFLLLLLALPFHYGGKVSWHSGQGDLEWYLTWGWLISLDKIVKRRQIATSDKPIATGDEGSIEQRTQHDGMHDRERKRETVKKSIRKTIEEAKKDDKKNTEKKVEEELADDMKKELTEEIKKEIAIEGTQETPREFPLQPDIELRGDIPSAENVESVATTLRETEAEPIASPKRTQRVADESSSKTEAIPDTTNDPETVTAHDFAKDLWNQREWFCSWLARIWNLLHLTPLIITGEVGLGDPFQTNQLFRRFISVRPFLPRALALRIQPDYIETVLELDITLDGWVSPLQILWVALCLILDSTAHRFYKKYRFLLSNN